MVFVYVNNAFIRIMHHVSIELMLLLKKIY